MTDDYRYPDARKAIKTRLDLAEFVKKMALELKAHPERWENATLLQFLQALSAYLVDVAGYCQNMAPDIDPDRPEWSLFATVLAGAIVYE